MSENVKVKPLEWTDDHAGRISHTNKTQLGWYEIYVIRSLDGPTLTCHLMTGFDEMPTSWRLGEEYMLDDAKAACQRDYERRVRELLE